MPPADSNKNLTATQIALLKRWVAEGAPWGRHWAYMVPHRPAVPAVEASADVLRNPIDNFIRARLEREGMEPSPEADRRTLFRRLNLDLLGLPPNWLAGGGIKGGQVIGETDDIAWNVTKEPVHVHDLHATLLHLFGFDHTRLTYRFQGRDYRLTDVHGRVVDQMLA
jgi:hypothetical protein